jgi:hypothetical protein
MRESEIILLIGRAVQAPQKGVGMRYGLLLLLLFVVLGLSSDLSTSERAQSSELQPIIFAAAFGSN